MQPTQILNHNPMQLPMLMLHNNKIMNNNHLPIIIMTTKKMSQMLEQELVVVEKDHPCSEHENRKGIKSLFRIEIMQTKNKNANPLKILKHRI